MIYKFFFKRFFDFIIASFLLIFFSPLFFFSTLVLFVQNQGNPFFFQLRPGLNGNLFFLIKFKTMSDEKDSLGNLLPDIKRITKLGRIIRNLSLDEIPQLINVIKGDMSLIGPRPLLVKYLPLYNDFQKRRHEVKPGITGWAQINGRNAISWQKKFELDVWYVDNVSFLLDLKIFFLTIKKVFIRADINQNSNLTMEPFNGKN